MAVYDRWHRSKPKPIDKRCKEHDLIASTDHMAGDRWQVRYRDKNGKQRKKNFALKAGKNPKIHAEAYDASVLLNPCEDSTDNRKVSLLEVSKLWEDSQIVDIRTRELTELKLKSRIIPSLGHCIIHDLVEDKSILRRWIQELRTDLAQSTAREYAGTVKSIFHFAYDSKIIDENPFTTRPIIKLPNRTIKVVTPFTTKQLDNIRHSLPELYKPVVDIGIGLGVRIGEIHGLGPDDIIDGDAHIKRQVRILKGTKYVFSLPKGGKTRIVPLPRKLAVLLKSLPVTKITLPWSIPTGKPRTVTVYMAYRGKPVERTKLQYAWYAALKYADIPRVPYDDMFHKLRHTYASRLLSSGIDIRALAEFLGHSDPGFTLRTYCHFMPSTRDQVRRALDEY